MKRFAVPLLTAAMVCGLAAESRAELIYGLTSNNALIRFDTATPGTVTAPLSITGLRAGTSLVGIDFRPATPGTLVGLGNVGGTGTVYTIDLITGAATSILSGFSLMGTNFGVDFNPVANALRIVSDTGQNLRITAGGSGVATVDGALNPGTPSIAGAAYTNNVPGGVGGATTLYNIDFATDRLVRQGTANFVTGGAGTSPNTGTLFDVGALGVNTSNLVGFDTSALSGIAYASLGTSPAAGISTLYTINLATGAASLVGGIGGGAGLIGIAVANVSEPGTLALAMIGVGVMGFGAWRRREC